MKRTHSQTHFNFYKVVAQKIVVTSKFCPVCKQDKLATEFYRMAASRDSLAGKCKVCQSEHHKKIYPSVKEKANHQAREWYQANKTRAHINYKKYMQKNPIMRIINKLRDDSKARSVEPLSFDAIQLKEYLTSLFVENMSWDNYPHVWQVKKIKTFPECSSSGEWLALKNLKPTFISEINPKRLSIDPAPDYAV